MVWPSLSLRPLLLAAALGGLGGGLAAHGVGRPDLAGHAFVLGTLPVLAGLLAEIVISLRRGDVGLDVVAALSMSAALVFGEHLAAAVVALMYAGGQYLERYAEGRARYEMTALLARAPRSALRHGPAGVQTVPVEDVVPGDRLLVRKGDVVPVDGTVARGVAVLDESSLTGESLPVRRMPGGAVLSGSLNMGEAFDLDAGALAADSAYAAIVRLVEGAQQARAPMARLADSYAMVFLAVTVALAGGAWWATGDPVRAVAVLVVATPCPLILAVPVALVAGLSRAASRGILIKSGRALEALARARVLVLDKTGTLTHGRARVTAVAPAAGFEAAEVLRLAAALDQASRHPVAEALVAEAAARGLALERPEDVVETAGEGVEGRVGPRRVAVGAHSFVALRAGLNGLPDDVPAGAVAVAVDGVLAGAITVADTVRADADDGLFAALRRAGIARIVMATGDRQATAQAVAGQLGFDAIRAELTPDEKVLVVLSERKFGPVMMLGDGVNDAPALAAADVGVAMGAQGATATAETADVVLMVDRIDRALPALRIARRARAIAVQSVVAGLGLSFAGMLAAAAGLITPVQGALLQEAIDLAVILNALRALGGDHDGLPGTPSA